MNIASLLQMVIYLSKNQPRRTAIFNFNNGEEDGLHGAHSCVVRRHVIWSLS
jgi:Zn-dependent M28 family amino/carboxypeptidase